MCIYWFVTDRTICFNNLNIKAKYNSNGRGNLAAYIIAPKMHSHLAKLTTFVLWNYLKSITFAVCKVHGHTYALDHCVIVEKERKGAHRHNPLQS